MWSWKRQTRCLEYPIVNNILISTEIPFPLSSNEIAESRARTRDWHLAFHNYRSYIWCNQCHPDHTGWWRRIGRRGANVADTRQSYCVCTFDLFRIGLDPIISRGPFVLLVLLIYLWLPLWLIRFLGITDFFVIWWKFLIVFRRSFTRFPLLPPCWSSSLNSAVFILSPSFICSIYFTIFYYS